MLMMETRQCFEHGGNIYRAARQTGAEFGRILDFSANINPLGLSEAVKGAIYASIPDLIHYPDPDGAELKQAICARYRLGSDMIALGNGAVELLYVLCNVLRPKRALIPAPSFSEYERAARAANAKIEYHYAAAEDDFQLSPDRLIPKLKRADIVFIGNPNNPTGDLLKREELERIIQCAQKSGCFVVVDESFIDFIDGDEAYTCRHLAATYDNLMVLYSLTKFYAIPGLRLGFAAANPALTETLRLAKDPWNVNLPAQKAGVAALNDSAYQRASREFIREEKAAFFRRIAKIQGLNPYEPSVNFILIALDQSVGNAKSLQAALLKEGVLIRDCSNYPGLDASFIRLAVKNREDNETCAQKLHKILTGGEKND